MCVYVRSCVCSHTTTQLFILDIFVECSPAIHLASTIETFFDSCVDDWFS